MNEEGREMRGVTEYGDELPVFLVETLGTYPDLKGVGRVVVKAYNEAGHNSTEVDVRQLIMWLRANRPDLLELEEA